MVYELTGSACEGYTQNMRFVTQMVNQSGTTMLTDLRSSSWEEGSGRRFRFNSSQFRDEKPTEVTAGDAARPGAADDVKVELTKPAKKDMSLPARVYFPIQHSIALLEAAKGGKAMFRADLYDGSEKGEKVYDTVSVIGRRAAPGGNRKLPPREERRATRRDWRRGRCRSAISSRAPTSSDAVPVYELASCSSRTASAASCSSTTASSPCAASIKEIVFSRAGKCERR